MKSSYCLFVCLCTHSRRDQWPYSHRPTPPHTAPRIQVTGHHTTARQDWPYAPVPADCTALASRIKGTAMNRRTRRRGRAKLNRDLHHIAAHTYCKLCVWQQFCVLCVAAVAANARTALFCSRHNKGTESICKSSETFKSALRNTIIILCLFQVQKAARQKRSLEIQG